MADKKLLATIALAAGLVGGGAAGLVLGVPGVSGAQTTTVPDQPGTNAPEAPADPAAPEDGRRNCPEKEGREGQAPGGSSSSNAGFRRVPGARA